MNALLIVYIISSILSLTSIILMLCSYKTQKYSEQKNIYDNKSTCDKSKIINTLFRQCARWSTASTQDKNPLIATLHANYAAGYLWALEDLFTADEIEEITNVKYRDFRLGIQKNQDITTKKILSSCPHFAQLDSNASVMIAKIAGEQ